MADLWMQFLLTLDATLRVATPLICARWQVCFQNAQVSLISRLKARCLWLHLPLERLPRLPDRR